MRTPLLQTPRALAPIETSAIGVIPSAERLGIASDPCPERQRGGRSEGLEVLRSFLGECGAAYSKELSSPLTAFQACSRLSPHLARGTLSVREVLQATRQRRKHWVASLDLVTPPRLSITSKPHAKLAAK